MRTLLLHLLVHKEAVFVLSVGFSASRLLIFLYRFSYWMARFTCRRDCSCQFPLYCQPTLIEVSCAPRELGVVQAASLAALQRLEDAALRALVICWPVSAVGPYLCQVPRNARCETRTCVVPSGRPHDAGSHGLCAWTRQRGQGRPPPGHGGSRGSSVPKSDVPAKGGLQV